MIFYIAPQRSGTKSFGNIMEGKELEVWSWNKTQKNRITELMLKRRFEELQKVLFESKCDVFEDYPFFHQEFIVFALHRFPDAKFVYLGRDESAWFTSLLSHSNGKNPGNDVVHADLYSRWSSLAIDRQFRKEKRVQNSLDLRFSVEHYVRWYKDHRIFIRDFFEVNRQTHRLFMNDWKSLDVEELLKFLELETSNLPNNLHKHRSLNKEEKLKQLFSD